jgi:hypothetical protein
MLGCYGLLTKEEWETEQVIGASDRAQNSEWPVRCRFGNAYPQTTGDLPQGELQWQPVPSK